MAAYDVTQLVGKTMKATGNVPLYRVPLDSAPAVFTVKPGQSIGVVYSYLLPKEGRTALYLMFYDSANKPYYMRWGAPVDTGFFKDQGAKSEKELLEEKAEKEKALPDKIIDNAVSILKYLAIAAGVAYLAKAVVDKKL